MEDRDFTTTPIVLSGTTTSGLEVAYSVTSGPATVTGSNLTLTGVGAVTVVASQAGDGNWLEATSVTRTFTVGQATATVMLSRILHK